MRDRKFIPVVRRSMGAGGGLISKVIGKETIKVDVSVNDKTINSLYALGGMITVGILAHAVLRKF